MKKVIALVLAMIMLLMFVGCKNVQTDDPTDAAETTTVPVSASKKDAIAFEDGQLYAVAYMGYQKMKPIEKYSEYLDDLDLQTYTISEGDFYLVIPRYDKTDLKLYKVDVATGEKTIFKEVKNSGAFIVQCNVSDIMNDASIELVHEDQKTEFSPFISLKDGSVQVGDKGLNITVEE